MLNNKIKYILVLFIILSLSMNAFSATNFTDDTGDVTLQSGSVDEVAADAADAVDDGADDAADDGAGDATDNTDNTNTEDTKTSKPTFGGNGTGFGGNGSKFSFGNSSFGGNGSGFNFGNMSFGGNNTTDFDIASILDYFTKMMGGNDTNTTNTTNETTDPEVSDVPEVVTSTSYVPVSHNTAKTVQAPAVKSAQHVIQRLRDNTTISIDNALRLGDINKLYDSDFTNGHLLVYVDGKLVFNEITAGDLSTPIFGITDDVLGQHQITVEFTANGNSNTNKYTEDVLII